MIRSFHGFQDIESKDPKNLNHILLCPSIAMEINFLDILRGIPVLSAFVTPVNFFLHSIYLHFGSQDLWHPPRLAEIVLNLEPDLNIAFGEQEVHLLMSHFELQLLDSFSRALKVQQQATNEILLQFTYSNFVKVHMFHFSKRGHFPVLILGLVSVKKGNLSLLQNSCPIIHKFVKDLLSWQFKFNASKFVLGSGSI